VQIEPLTRLRHLTLTTPHYMPDAYTALLRLTALERLELVQLYAPPPPCLGQLSWLRALKLAAQGHYSDYDGACPLLDDWHWGGDHHQAVMRDALPHLTQLTELTLPLGTEVSIALGGICLRQRCQTEVQAVAVTVAQTLRLRWQPWVRTRGRRWCLRWAR
jgi:hypothetical protein